MSTTACESGVAPRSHIACKIGLRVARVVGGALVAGIPVPADLWVPSLLAGQWLAMQEWAGSTTEPALIAGRAQCSCSKLVSLC